MDGEPARMYTPAGERWRLVERAEEAMLIAWASRSALLMTELSMLEWVSGKGHLVVHCPTCWNAKEEGHRSNCPTAAVLSADMQVLA
jgi:hypothetical protein